MTARWVVDEVAEARDLNIVWQPISLLFKNNPPPESEYYAKSVITHKMLRVMESVRSAYGDEPLFGLYWELATRIHNDRTLEFDVAQVLVNLGLDASHAAAGEDEDWDKEIRERMDAGLAMVGDDVGTPIIAWNKADGDRNAIFGPVITRVPTSDEAVRMWDAMIDLCDIDGFWELKRTRTQRPEFGERPANVSTTS